LPPNAPTHLAFFEILGSRATLLPEILHVFGFAFCDLANNAVRI